MYSVCFFLFCCVFLKLKARLCFNKHVCFNVKVALCAFTGGGFLTGTGNSGNAAGRGTVFHSHFHPSHESVIFTIK